jgi:hypothetical protein
LLEFIDLFLQDLQSPLILLDEGQDGCLCGRWIWSQSSEGIGGCKSMQLTYKPS